MRILYSLFLCCLLSGRVEAQLSPGDLANAHKDLEGMAKCTQCHDLGNKVSNGKCLSCRQEIKTRIDRNKGFHISRDVKGKECAKCHSDHHGRNFDMVRFDEKTFDHNLAGYELTGRHKSGWSSKGQKIDCRSCHKPDLIAEPELKKKKLSSDWDMNALIVTKMCTRRPLAATVQNVTLPMNLNPLPNSTTINQIALRGRHKTVACIDCHLKETKNGEPYQRFSGIVFKNCNSCHKDAHNNNLGPNCKECHTETAFTDRDGLSKFNHNNTLFALKGKHKQVNCKECHQLLARLP